MKYSILLLSLLTITRSIFCGFTSNPYDLYIMAHYNLLQEKVDAADKYYQKLMPSASPYAHFGFLQFLSATGQHKAIVHMMPDLEGLFQDDLPTQLLFGQSLAEAGDEQHAAEKFISLQKQHKSNQDLTYLAAVSHGKTNPQKATEVIIEYLNNSPGQPRDCVFYFMLSQFFMTLNNKNEAIVNIKKAVELCPRFDKGWLFLGLLQEQEGHINDAIEGYTRYLQLVGSNKKVEQQLQRLLLQSKVNSSAHASAKKVQPALVLQTALTQYKAGNFPQALTACNECLKKNPVDQDARLLKLQILSAMNQPQQALDLIQTYIASDANNEVWYKALYLLYHAGLSAEKVVAVLEQVEKKHPDTLQVHLYLADMYTRQRNVPQAVAFHHKALSKTQDASLKSKILYNLASIYFETEQFSLMKKTIEEAQALQSTFPPLHNLMAYYYASKGANVSLAQHYLDIALKHDASNPHFLDTQALIWYRQHDYTKAQNLLEKVSQQVPHDYFVHYHLAKTYYKQRNNDLAYTTMKKTVSLARTEQQKAKCTFFLEQWKHN